MLFCLWATVMCVVETNTLLACITLYTCAQIIVILSYLKKEMLIFLFTDLHCSNKYRASRMYNCA